MELCSRSLDVNCHHPSSSSRRRPGSRRPRRPGLLHRTGERDAGAPQGAATASPDLAASAMDPSIPDLLYASLLPSNSGRRSQLSASSRRRAPDPPLRLTTSSTQSSGSASSCPRLGRVLRRTSQGPARPGTVPHRLST